MGAVERRALSGHRRTVPEALPARRAGRGELFGQERGFGGPGSSLSATPDLPELSFSGPRLRHE